MSDLTRRALLLAAIGGGAYVYTENDSLTAPLINNNMYETDITATIETQRHWETPEGQSFGNELIDPRGLFVNGVEFAVQGSDNTYTLDLADGRQISLSGNLELVTKSFDPGRIISTSLETDSSVEYVDLEVVALHITLV